MTELPKIRKFMFDTTFDVTMAPKPVEAKPLVLKQAEVDAMKQQADLMNKYHGRVQESLGPVNAARFFEIDSQLNSIIELQIDSSLPVGQE